MVPVAIIIAGVKQDIRGKLVFDPKAIAAGANYDYLGQLVYKPILDPEESAAGVKPEPPEERLASQLFKSIYAAKDSLKRKFPKQ